MWRFVVMLGVAACSKGAPAAQHAAGSAASVTAASAGDAGDAAQAGDGESPFAELCASLEADRAEREAQRSASDRECAKLPQPQRDQCMVDPPGDPACEVSPVAVSGLAAPWREVAVYCSTRDEVYGPKECSIVIDHDGSLLVGPGFSLESRAGELAVDTAAVQDVIAGGPPELVLRYTVTIYGEATEHVSVCRSAACSTPISVGAAGWKASVRFERGSAVLERAGGNPPADGLGTKPLVFQ
jgi:hypothetical protein